MSRPWRILSTTTGAFRTIPLARRIVLLTIMLLVAVYAGDVLIVAIYYRALAERVRDSRDAKTELLAEHAGRAMAAVDLSLKTLAEELKQRRPLNKLTVFTQLALDKYAKGLPQVRALLVAGQDGRVLNNSLSFPPPTLNIVDRLYFSEQKKWRGVGLYVDRVAISRIDGQPFFAMSRPILDDDGNFEGIIAAEIDPGYFAAFYAPRGQDLYETAVLERKDGAILAGSRVSNRHQIEGTDLARGTRRTDTSTRDVQGFPANIVVIGNAVATSPQFLNFCAVNVGLLLVMTFIVGWLSRAAAREAATVDREARARRTAEGRLLQAIEGTPAGFALYDHDDRLVLSNETYRSMFSRVRHLIVSGVSFQTLVEACIAHKLYADLDESQDSDFTRWRVARHRGAGNETTLELADGRWILTRERRTGEGDLVCFFSDITRLKQQEEALRRSEKAEKTARQRAEEADRAKTSFLATMSHELRTPLNAIIGFAEMIEKKVMGPLPSTYEQYAGIIRTSGHHLLSIINDILDIAKLNSGKTELHLESVNVSVILAEALAIVGERANSAGVQITTPDSACLPSLRADAVRLRQVLINVLTNAVKFTQPGGRIDVSISTESDYVCIIIKDTGIGIASGDISRVLQPFVQVRVDQQHAHEGTGLGLPISKMLIELHGGRFEIASELNVGTTVRIYLPLAGLNSRAAEQTVADAAVRI